MWLDYKGTMSPNRKRNVNNSLFLRFRRKKCVGSCPAGTIHDGSAVNSCRRQFTRRRRNSSTSSALRHLLLKEKAYVEASPPSGWRSCLRSRLMRGHAAGNSCPQDNSCAKHNSCGFAAIHPPHPPYGTFSSRRRQFMFFNNGSQCVVNSETCCVILNVLK